jgi:hypothetical protein
VEIVAVLPSPFYCSCRLAIETQLSERIVFCLVDGDAWSSGSPGLIPPGGAQAQAFSVARSRSPLQPARGELPVFDWDYGYHNVDKSLSFWQRVGQTIAK